MSDIFILHPYTISKKDFSNSDCHLLKYTYFIYLRNLFFDDFGGKERRRGSSKLSYTDVRLKQSYK